MSHSTKFVVVKRGSLLLIALAVVLSAGLVVQALVRVDPFKHLKQTSKDVDPSLGVRIDNAKLQSYEKGKLVTSADIDRLDVRQDKAHYDLWGVHNGAFYSDKGAMKFDAPQAVWNVPVHQLDATEGARIQAKDLDLKVGPFNFRSDKGLVSVPGPVTGMINKGDVSTRAVQYNVNDGSFKAGPMTWRGQVALGQQDPKDQGDRPRTWTIHSDGEMYSKGDISVYPKAEATDGDIIVLADLVEHNDKTDIVTATGNVRYFSSKANMTCDKAVIERGPKKATMTGNVRMYMKAKEKQDLPASKTEEIPPYHPIVPEDIAKSRPQPDQKGQTADQKKLDDELRSSKNLRDFPTICAAEKIVYWYKKGERHADISEGHPQALQNLHDGMWRQVWTNTAHYDGEKETLQMNSSQGQQDTRMINSKGDDSVADWVRVSTKDGDDEMHALHIHATFLDSSDEIPRDKSKKNGKGGDPGIGKGGGTGTTGGGTGTTGGGTGTGTTGGGGGTGTTGGSTGGH